MPRLTDDQIKAGIRHADIDVRTAALRYFADCHSPDLTIMPVVIEMLEQFGRAKAFRHLHPFAHLAQSEATIRWAVEELKALPHRSEVGQEYRNTLWRLLNHADPRLVQPFDKDIHASASLGRQHRDHLTRRLKLLSWDGEALWRELEAICEEGKDKTYAGDMRWNDAQDIVDNWLDKEPSTPTA
jgi:hypothetical protein